MLIFPFKSKQRSNKFRVDHRATHKDPLSLVCVCMCVCDRSAQESVHLMCEHAICSETQKQSIIHPQAVTVKLKISLNQACYTTVHISSTFAWIRLSPFISDTVWKSQLAMEMPAWRFQIKLNFCSQQMYRGDRDGLVLCGSLNSLSELNLSANEFSCSWKGSGSKKKCH